jgi:transposase InsO family protein
LNDEYPPENTSCSFLDCIEKRTQGIPTPWAYWQNGLCPIYLRKYRLYTKERQMADSKKYALAGSVSRPRCPYDNACLESFFSTAKKERIYRKEYGTLEEAQSDLFEYVGLFITGSVCIPIWDTCARLSTEWRKKRKTS